MRNILREINKKNMGEYTKKLKGVFALVKKFLLINPWIQRYFVQTPPKQKKVGSKSKNSQIFSLFFSNVDSAVAKY